MILESRQVPRADSPDSPVLLAIIPPARLKFEWLTFIKLENYQGS